ncbi:hypothetical protein PC118_g14131 [Phytophthora cactorum]|uniref:Mitochondrial carrier domain n=2 Tax=Phytophthora cactorum TaxID=29920 RepID=A0A8T1D2Z2_9STRA|nr:hypothetical protein PC111_g4235 [Phytophthora cactorum]KAG2849373.1 hypothetical protein PC113_g17434 [Phytophthora cactorum]KAG2932570.1 hypothetical protein PC115_g5743 [Phytophthora cactorum]KAG2955552.1 hypothetical protein PC117_g381 [Phytophthora cactorum]KAG2975140.1 hypothetical protein PC118_g14131 [Phytophthora cactorum]
MTPRQATVHKPPPAALPRASSRSQSPFCSRVPIGLLSMSTSNVAPQHHSDAHLAHLHAVGVAQRQQSVGLKILLGGIANTISAAATNPIDVVKVRLQLQALQPTAVTSSAAAAAGTVAPTRYLGFGHGLKTIVQEEGWYGLAKGWKASLLREFTYSGIRFGMYDQVKEFYEDQVFHTPPAEHGRTPLYIKLLSGATSGGIGSALVNPMDLVKVRMQADRTGTRYNNSFIFACRKIYQEEGLIQGFYRGVAPTTFRAMVLTAAQLPSYDHMKETLLHHTPLEEGVTVHMICSMFAGLTAATASSPLDVMKTQIMNETKLGGRNVLGRAFIGVLRTEGIPGFFKGWLANWFRLGPHTIISLMVYEELRAAMGIKPV